MGAKAELTVRRLRPGDYEPWLHFWRAYQEFYNADIPEETTAENWRRLFDSEQPVAGFLALVKGAPTGIVHALTHRSFWTTGDYCYLQDLYVAPTQRGGGVGRALIEAVRRYAFEMECSRVYWLTHESNAKAMLLYDRIAKKSGFIQYVQPGAVNLNETA
jgi:GNAT superfamily N-acetyltransferase